MYLRVMAGLLANMGADYHIDSSEFDDIENPSMPLGMRGEP